MADKAPTKQQELLDLHRAVTVNREGTSFVCSECCDSRGALRRWPCNTVKLFFSGREIANLMVEMREKLKA